ncbi:MAG: efflux RND transporter periplasmic adaptor subunit [Pseudomonadota bacterium]
MKKVSKPVLTFGAFTAIVVAAVVSLSSGASGRDDTQERPLISVETARIALQERYEIKATYPGRVRAGRRSQLGFERGGLLANVFADEGDVVSKGTVIAKLDQRQLKAQLVAAQAQVTAADAQVAEAKAAQDLAVATRERQRTLLEKGHISQQRFDDTEFQRRAADAGLASAKAQRASSKADRDALNVMLSLSDLVAPFDGFVVKRFADEGTVLAPGSPIFDFEERGPLEFVSGVPVDAVSGIKNGTKLAVAIGGTLYDASLDRIVNALDQNTRTAQLVLRLPQETSRLSGEVGKLSLSRMEIGTGFWAPLEALQEGERGLWTVFVAVPDMGGKGRIERHPVELLYSELGRAFVRGTPDNGSLLVTAGVDRLVAGQTVNITQPRS